MARRNSPCAAPPQRARPLPVARFPMARRSSPSALAPSPTLPRSAPELLHSSSCSSGSLCSARSRASTSLRTHPIFSRLPGTAASAQPPPRPSCAPCARRPPTRSALRPSCAPYARRPPHRASQRRHRVAPLFELLPSPVLPTPLARSGAGPCPAGPAPSPTPSSPSLDPPLSRPSRPDPRCCDLSGSIRRPFGWIASSCPDPSLPWPSRSDPTFPFFSAAGEDTMTGVAACAAVGLPSEAP
jgi:hypothetical protein